jgi:iron complex outermembrane receptor protein
VNTQAEKDRFIQCLTQLQNTWQINYFSSLQTSVYHTFLKGNYDFDLNNFLEFPSTDELFNYAVQSNLLGVYSNYTFSKKRFKWITGFHGNIYNRQHTGSEKTLGELYQNTGYKNEASFFTKADYTVKWLTFFADLQYRYVNFDYKGSVYLPKMDWRFINPKAGLSVAINSNSTVYYSIGRTGKEPTRNDMFGGEDDLLADELGNAILFNTDPEYVLNHELGFRYQQKKLNFNLNLYYMDFSNEIVLDGKFGPNGLALTNNVEQSIRTGIELSIVYKIKHFAFINNSSFNYSRIEEQNEIFSPILTPPIIINQEIVHSQNNFTVALSAKYQHKSYIDFANSSTVNGYFLLNGRASYDFKNFVFSLFLNNITNAQYFNHGYIDFDESKKYFVQAPINFYVSVQYSF